MDYGCPVCKVTLPKRKLGQSIVARMEIDCPYCASRIRMNVHRAELIIVLVNFAAIVVLGASAYWYQRQDLVLLALGVAMVGALALPLLEQTYLRAWPRYAPIGPRPGPGS